MIYVLTKDVPELSLRAGDYFEGGRGLGALLGRRLSPADHDTLLADYSDCFIPRSPQPKSGAGEQHRLTHPPVGS